MNLFLNVGGSTPRKFSSNCLREINSANDWRSWSFSGKASRKNEMKKMALNKTNVFDGLIG